MRTQKIRQMCSGWKRPLETTWCNYPLLKLGQLKHVAQDLVEMDLEYLHQNDTIIVDFCTDKNIYVIFLLNNCCFVSELPPICNSSISDV